MKNIFFMYVRHRRERLYKDEIENTVHTRLENISPNDILKIMLTNSSVTKSVAKYVEAINKIRNGS
jgi:hypothetical protein